MADINLFSHGAFSMTTLSAAIQQAPYTPQLLGQLGIFTPDRVRTTTIAVEQKGGVLSLIGTSERGAPIEEGKGEKRDIRHFATSRIARGKTLMAAELQNIRAFGQTSEMQAVQNEVAEIMNGKTGLRAAVELTHEHMPWARCREWCWMPMAVSCMTGLRSSASTAQPPSTLTLRRPRRRKARCA